MQQSSFSILIYIYTSQVKHIYENNKYFLIFVITALLAGVMLFSFSKVNAQNSTTNLQFQNTGNMTSSGEKSYILIFGQRTIGNIDNSTKIVSSIVGHSIVKINEEFLEEISLAPTQQLENQVNKIIQDGLGGSSCGGDSLITQEGQKVSVDCISSKDAIIWYIHP